MLEAALLFGLMFGIAQEQPQRTSQIVVIAPDTARSEAALKACLARQCAVGEDVDAAMDHAQMQFLAGDYRKAKDTLRAAWSRNKAHKDDAPEPLSELLRMTSRVDAHLGYFQQARWDNLQARSLLRGAFGERDDRTLAARIEMGDMWVRAGRAEVGREVYADAIKVACEGGRLKSEGLAMLRLASLETQLAMQPGGTEFPESLDELIARNEPELSTYATVGRILRARLALKRGDATAMTQLLAETRAMDELAPPLVDEPTVDLVAGMAGARPRDEGNWADFGFWIEPDGQVSDVEVLRLGKSVYAQWVPLAAKAIGERRYMSRPLSGDVPGLYRIERFTITSRLIKPTGSRMWSRSNEWQLLQVDLTP